MNQPYNALPSQEILHSLFLYRDGELIAIKRTGPRTKLHRSVGWKDAKGYHRVQINGVAYARHRLVWMYFHGVDPGPLDIDHVNEVTAADVTE